MRQGTESLRDLSRSLSLSLWFLTCLSPAQRGSEVWSGNGQKALCKL